MSIEPCYRYRAKLTHAVDGDTYRLAIDLGLYVTATVDVRLRGWDCPELAQPGGAEARIAARNLLSSGNIVVETYKGRRSFARWVADVYVGGELLGHLLEREGHATLADPG